MLVLRCYGFCTVLISPRWLVSVGVKARVQRTGFLVVRESDRREKQEQEERRRARESFAHWRVVFKQSDLAPPTGGCSNQCPCGAEPRLHSSSCKAHDHSSSDI